MITPLKISSVNILTIPSRHSFICLGYQHVTIIKNNHLKSCHPLCKKIDKGNSKNILSTSTLYRPDYVDHVRVSSIAFIGLLRQILSLLFALYVRHSLSMFCSFVFLFSDSYSWISEVVFLLFKSKRIFDLLATFSPETTISFQTV